ncbi:MAG: hypothetical protein ACXV7C_06705 [Candidatus Angelobacter sp.]
MRLPPPLDVRLFLVLVADVRVFHRRGFTLVPILAEPLAPPVVAVPGFNNLALQCPVLVLIANLSVFHPLAFQSPIHNLPITNFVN